MENSSIKAVCIVLFIAHTSLVPRPLPQDERAWYTLHVHALDIRGGCGYTRHSQTREQVMTKQLTISIIQVERLIAALPTLPAYGPSQTVKAHNRDWKPDKGIFALVD